MYPPGSSRRRVACWSRLLARVQADGGESAASLPDQTLSGKVVYGGYGCPADQTVVPKASDYTDAQLGIQPGDERILLMQRGPSGDPSAD